MGFLSGTVSFDGFRIEGAEVRGFGQEHIKTLEKHSIDHLATSAVDQPDVGFLAGDHLLDCGFALEKNVIGDALHCALRIDTNQVPAAIRKAWLQMELAPLAAENPRGRPTKLQRQEAKEAVEARCQEVAASGKFRRMSQFPLLWDARNAVLLCGGTSASAQENCLGLCDRAFELELHRLTAGRRAAEWAAAAKRRKLLDDVLPSAFHEEASTDIAWWNQESGNFDFLGNEFLLWLWWRWQTQSDTIELADGTSVVGMFARTLSLQCPLDESGKETISAEGPTELPEAALALCSGKLPRRAGLTLVRAGQQYDLVLQAETFTIGGAKIRNESDEDGDDGDGRGVLEDRIESVRALHETVGLLFEAFCQRRIDKAWSGGDLTAIRRWLKKGAGRDRSR